MHSRTIRTHDALLLSKDFDLFTDSPFPDGDLIQQRLMLPLVLRRDALIWGFNIVRTANELGIPELPCAEVEGDVVRLLSLAVKLEDRRDLFTLREKAAILDFLKARNVSDRVGEISPLIQAEGSFEKQADKYLQLSDSLKELVDSEYIDLKTALMISPVSDAAINQLADIFSSSSFSKRRQAFRFFYEIGMRDSLSEEALYDFAVTLASEDDPLKALEVFRFPRMTEMRNLFESTSDRILKGSGITLTEPPGFEGSGFSVSFRFTGKKQLSRVITRLKDLEKESDELFSLLR